MMVIINIYQEVICTFHNAYYFTIHYAQLYNLKSSENRKYIPNLFGGKAQPDLNSLGWKVWPEPMETHLQSLLIPPSMNIHPFDYKKINLFHCRMLPRTSRAVAKSTNHSKGPEFLIREGRHAVTTTLWAKNAHCSHFTDGGLRLLRLAHAVSTMGEPLACPREKPVPGTTTSPEGAAGQRLAMCKAGVQKVPPSWTTVHDMRSPEFQLWAVWQTDLFRESEEQTRVEMSKGKTRVGRCEQGPDQGRV